MAAAASTKAMVGVFDHPELAEMILRHIANPAKLFALRRVHPAFRDAIAASIHTRQRMLPEKPGRVSILKLNTILYDKFLKRAIHPFAITQIHVQAATNTLWLTLTLDLDWGQCHWWRDDTETLLHATRNGSGSWKDLRIEHPGMKVAVVLRIPHIKGCPAPYWQTVKIFGLDEGVNVDDLIGVVVRVSVTVNRGDKENAGG